MSHAGESAETKGADDGVGNDPVVRRRVTLVDVARRAGVSHSTVSRVLTGAARISEPTRERVLAAVDELGYVTHVGARRLAGGQSGVIGLLIRESQSPYAVQVVHAVDTALAGRGMNLMLCTTDNRGPIERYVSSLRSQVDGLIGVVDNRAPSYAAELVAHGFPLVLLDHAPYPGAVTISPSNHGGVLVAVQHVVELGHTRVGYIGGGGGTDSAAQRLAGFLDARLEHNCDDDPALVADAAFSREAGYSAMSSLLELERPPTAVVVSSDIAAAGAIDAATAAGVSIPEDVSIIGFDDVPLAAVTEPPLTTMRQPIEHLGDLAMDALMGLLAGEELPVTDIVLPVELVVRSSTAPPREH